MKNPKFVLNYKIFLWIEIVTSVLFTLISPVFHFDISILAFLLCSIFTVPFVYFGVIKVLKEKDQTKAGFALKFAQYAPTVLFIAFILRRSGHDGTAFWYDLVSVILWTINFIGCVVFQIIADPKRVEKMDDYWLTKAPKKEKLHGIKWVIFDLIDWVDNLLQILVMMMVIQIFTYQLYVIPSESMVPTFLIKDRVLVNKMMSGPKFPLTEVGLPVLGKYKRGDIVVLRNPHYSMDRKSEIKTTTSQLISWLTLMTVNMNVDDHGEMKADPLVKRIAGVEGEQLVMQDGVLYTRTKDSDVFKPIDKKEDFAAWNLNTALKNANDKVQYLPLRQAEYDRMISFEEERRNYDLKLASVRARLIAEEVQKLSSENSSVTFKRPDNAIMDLFRNNYEISLKVLTQKGGTEWFTDFMTAWIGSLGNERDIYAESNYRLNVMAKITFGEIVLRNAKLIVSDTSGVWSNDEELKELMGKADLIYWYVQGLLDMRNMPVFPANNKDGTPNYIPENCYFMMGDNRFNSLDLRHSYDSSMRPLTSQDPYSMTYSCMMNPQYISRKLIVGKPKFIVWPLGRSRNLNN